MHDVSPDGSAPPETPPSPPAAPVRRSWWRELRLGAEGLDARATVAACVAMTALVLSHYQGGTNFFRNNLAGHLGSGSFKDVLPYLYWFGASVFFYLCVPLVSAALTPGVRVRETGLGFGDARWGLLATGLLLAVFLPVVYLASLTPEFAGHYPLCGAAKNGWRQFVSYEAGYAAYFVAWEYLFRGYLLFSFEPRMGKLAAVAQMMPFAIIHAGKPEAEALGSIVAGIVLGLVALRARSFWYGAIVHIGVAVFMDVLASWAALRG